MLGEVVGLETNMKHYMLERTSLGTVSDQNYQVAVLPWGATEPHNYHLPYGTDSLETTIITELAAGIAWDRGAKIMVLPTIPLGAQNLGQIEIPFCLHTRPSTQKRILEDVLNSLRTQGITKFVLMNGHGGNDFKGIIRELQPQFPELLICLVEWFGMLGPSEYFEKHGEHAGEMETSIMMFCFPELVAPLDRAGRGKTRPFALQGLQDGTAWAPRRWDKISEDTGVGDPRGASAEKGKRFVEDVTATIADFLVELAACRLEDLYERSE
jgi:creatinine amidohydrolase